MSSNENDGKILCQFNDITTHMCKSINVILDYYIILTEWCLDLIHYQSSLKITCFIFQGMQMKFDHHFIWMSEYISDQIWSSIQMQVKNTSKWYAWNHWKWKKGNLRLMLIDLNSIDTFWAKDDLKKCPTYDRHQNRYTYWVQILFIQ